MDCRSVGVVDYKGSKPGTAQPTAVSTPWSPGFLTLFPSLTSPDGSDYSNSFWGPLVPSLPSFVLFTESGPNLSGGKLTDAASARTHPGPVVVPVLPIKTHRPRSAARFHRSTRRHTVSSRTSKPVRYDWTLQSPCSSPTFSEGREAQGTSKWHGRTTQWQLDGPVGGANRRGHMKICPLLSWLFLGKQGALHCLVMTGSHDWQPPTALENLRARTHSCKL